MVVVQAIVEEVRSTIVALRQQLVADLSKATSLPKELEVPFSLFFFCFLFFCLVGLLG